MKKILAAVPELSALLAVGAFVWAQVARELDMPRHTQWVVFWICLGVLVVSSGWVVDSMAAYLMASARRRVDEQQRQNRPPPMPPV